MSEEEYNEYIDELRMHGTRELAEEVYRLEQEYKELQQENKELKEDITWWSNRFNAVERDNRELKEKTKPYFKQKEFQEYRDKNKEKYLYLLEEKNNLYHRLDKAIEYMKSIENEPDYDSYYDLGEYKEYKALLNILDGDK